MENAKWREIVAPSVSTKRHISLRSYSSVVLRPTLCSPSPFSLLFFAPWALTIKLRSKCAVSLVVVFVVHMQK